MFWLGGLAFASFFLSDCNDLWWGKKPLSVCFPAGAALLCVSVILQLLRQPAPVGLAGQIPAWAGAAVFGGLLVWTLTGALGQANAYAAPGAERSVCRTGVYALCRHPGVLWLAGLLLCLYPAGGLPLWCCPVYTLLNVLLVLFEDHWVFPRRLAGYDAYKREVPFLIPTASSLRAAALPGRPR